jgi:hypothetical protein
MSDLEQHHRIALARELTAVAGVPLRDRYGFASPDEQVAAVLAIVALQPDDAKAADRIGLDNGSGVLELADGYDTPIDEEYERRIVRALRPLIENRRTAAARSLP